MKLIWKILVLNIIFIGFGFQAFAQDRFEPPYPRIGMLDFVSARNDFSNGSRNEYIAQYDMLIIDAIVENGGHQQGEIMRQLNPDQILLGTAVNGLWLYDPVEYNLTLAYRGTLLQDVVAGQGTIYLSNTENMEANGDIYITVNNDIVKAFGVVNDTTLSVVTNSIDPLAFNTSHAAGSEVYCLVRVLGGGLQPNFSSFAPQVDGRYVWEYLANKNFNSKMNWTAGIFDGFFHDYFHIHPGNYENKDFDLNAVADWGEHGETWMINEWLYGTEKFLHSELDTMNLKTPDLANLMCVNNGAGIEEYFDLINGCMIEGYQRFSDWEYVHDDLVAWMQNGKKPNMCIIYDYIKEDHFYNGRERYTQRRFGLTHSMLTECYYGITAGSLYQLLLWYDEFDADMGYPVDDQIHTLSNGCLARQFTKGIAICNPTGLEQTVTSGMLAAMPSPTGNLYRMKGGQDPDFNTGELFDDVALSGIDYGSHNLRGDGILLFYDSTTVVADIVVDNFRYNATSPGSEPVVLEGYWVKNSSDGYTDMTQNNPYYCQWGSERTWSVATYTFNEAYGYHATYPGNGDTTATWVPTIGVPGWYEVSEWHGWHGNTAGAYAEATNVPFQIVVNNDTKIHGIINQQANAGQWNRLGFAYMPKGTNSFVRINNKANGYVIADAMRFRFMGDDYVPDLTPPEKPQNVQIVK